jgi:hypothetical protein
VPANCNEWMRRDSPGIKVGASECKRGRWERMYGGGMWRLRVWAVGGWHCFGAMC